MSNQIPRVVDISHYNTVVNFSDVAKAGVWGVIHKATLVWQGGLKWD